MRAFKKECRSKISSLEVSNKTALFVNKKLRSLKVTLDPHHRTGGESRFMEDRLIRIDELVELLGEKSRQAVYNKLNRGVFPIPTYKVGKSLCWKFREVQDFINELQPINQ